MYRILMFLLLIVCGKAIADVPVYSLAPSELTNCKSPVILEPLYAIGDKWNTHNPKGLIDSMRNKIKKQAESTPGVTMIAGYHYQMSVSFYQASGYEDYHDYSINADTIVSASGVAVQCDNTETK